MLIELKWDKSAESAIRQIKSREYLSVLKDYEDNVLLIVVNYDRDSKRHECVIKTEKVADTLRLPFGRGQK
ncbi:MAG: hypothetical protein LBS84_12820 [Clostridiales bacterium]|nr:hypothetical protein [Clostridiales bacterium]